MKSFDYDLQYLKAGLEVIEEYLLSDEVFWPLSASPPKGAPDYPRLTLGGLLLVKVRLSAYKATQLQEVQRQMVLQEMDRFRSKWEVAWEKKAGRSFSVRLRMWRDFIEEYQMSPLENADRYSYEVRLRAMLTLLNLESGAQPQAEADLLMRLDGYIKGVLEMDEFVWESEIQSGFPPSTYWYLYGYLPPKVKRYRGCLS